MKRLIIYTLVFLIACVVQANAQSFIPTWGYPCIGCTPTGYEVMSGSPAISNPTGLGGSNQSSWQGLVPNPPSVADQQGLAPAAQKSFLTLKQAYFSKINQQDIVRVKVEKFVVGKSYNFHFSNLFSRTAVSNSAQSITVKVMTGGPNPTTLKTVTINSLGENYWANNTLTFIPTESVLYFVFSAQTMNGTTGYVNLDISQYAFDCVIPNAQVQLFHSNATTRYPCGKIPLNSYIKSLNPPNSFPVWKSGSLSGNDDLSSAQESAAPVGEYYAFYKDQTMPACFNVQTSTAKAVLSYIETQALLTNNTAINNCPESTVNLETGLVVDPNQILQLNEERRWFKNNTHQGVPENANAISTSGDYYAFLYNKEFNCYSTDLSTSKVTVSINACPAGTAQVALTRSNAVNTCPATTVNLNNTTVTNQPPLTSIAWYTDAQHNNQVADPTKVGAGIYYAFFKDNATGSFNTHLSTSTLTVTINPCETKVSLNLKVFLQGATTLENGVATMRNDLQIYKTSPTTFGLLPTQDPYGGGAVYPEIKNTFSKAGNIVDWVQIEIRSMQNPSIVLESKSLLLRVDGTVLDVDGYAPKFNPQFGGVRIAVKHRNHLPVIGLGLVSFNAGTANYDFSADLSKAYNVVAKPQMILKSGVWCMIAADTNSDFFIDSGDVPDFKSAFKANLFKTYHKTDLNMDGLVDSADVTIFNNNFKAGYYSSLTKYLSK